MSLRTNSPQSTDRAAQSPAQSSSQNRPAQVSRAKALRLFAYFAIYVFWGGSFLAIRDMVATTPPFFSAGLRFTAAGVTLYLVSRLRGVAAPTRRELVHSSWLGLVMFTGSYAGLFWAETRIASGTAAVIMAMIPIWILLSESLVLKTQPLTAYVVTGTLLGVAGVGLVSRSVGFDRGMLAGAAALIGCTLLFSFGTLWSRSLTLPADQIQRSGLQMALGGFGQLLVAALAGDFARLPAAFAAWRWHTTVSFLYLVLLASIIAFTAYTWLIHHEPATRVASYAYVNPLIALLLGVTLGGEHVSALQAIGAAMIIIGVFATLLSKSKASVAPPPVAGSVVTR
jgi:drug/metabolite transporter (DMT)-like permease